MNSASLHAASTSHDVPRSGVTGRALDIACTRRHGVAPGRAWPRALVSAVISVFAAACASATGDPVESREEALCAPHVPAALTVPAGNRLAFSYEALGVQIYVCSREATEYAWTLKAPEATLFDDRKRIAGVHGAGPTWEANDGSKVVAAKVSEFTSSPGAIPWLLLRATDHAGDGRMTKVTFIQRLNTAGGKAPTGGCDAAHDGGHARVDYAATYYFYELRAAK